MIAVKTIKKRTIVSLAASGIVAIGLLLTFRTLATSPVVDVQAEAGTHNGGAGLVNDQSASGGMAVKFGSDQGVYTTLFGACVWENDGESYAQALAREHTQFGPLQIVRVYLANTNPLVSWTSPQLSSNLPMQVSFKGDPAVVVAGTEDQKYIDWFKAAPKDRDIYWTFFHEPDDNIVAPGQPTDATHFTADTYVAAWRHLKQLANQANNPRLLATLTLMNWTLYPESGRGVGSTVMPQGWKSLYPGGDVIDVMAWDVANLKSGAGIYQTPEELYGPVIAANQSIGKPTAVAEWGVALLNGDQGAGRAAWMKQQGEFFVKNHFLYATYFNSTVGGESRLLDTPSMQALQYLEAHNSTTQ